MVRRYLLAKNGCIAIGVKFINIVVNIQSQQYYDSSGIN